MDRPEHPHTPESINIAARFFEAADRYPDSPAVGTAGEDAYLTYAQLADKIRETAVFLGTVEPGEPIGILSENRPAWGKIYLAILARGGIVVPVDSLLKKDELKIVFSESGIRRLFVSHRFAEIAEEVNRGLDGSIELISLESIPPTDPSTFVPSYSDDPDRPAVLIFTSGTTGKSKKVILTHRNILSDIDGIIDYLPFGPGDRFLSVLPLHHTFEATCGFLTPLTHGCTVFYLKTLNSREVLDGISMHRVTHFISVPLLYEKLYHAIVNGINKAPAPKRAAIKLMMKAAHTANTVSGANPGKKLFRSLRKKAGLESVRLMVCGGAPLPLEISRNFNLLGFDFVEGYGLTETSPVLSVNPAGKNKFGSVGPPLKGVNIRIDQPNELGVGEVLVQGPMVTPGYRDNPEETAKLLKDGWLHTGDLGRLDKDGYLYIIGRKKNLIVSAAGKNIYPEEIENELVCSPFIMEAMVSGKKVESGREEVAVMIYPDFDTLGAHLGKKPADITDAEIKAVIDPEVKSTNARMADYKRIKHVTYLKEEMEKTSTRKIKRYKYRS